MITAREMFALLREPSQPHTWRQRAVLILQAAGLIAGIVALLLAAGVCGPEVVG